MDILGLFCKVPTGDSTDWLMLPYGARGLLLQLWRKVGHDGRLELGRHGLRGVAGHVGSLADWPAVEVDLKALLEAGAVIHHAEAGQLEIVGYVEHQGAYARTKAAERMRRKREQRPTVSEHGGTLANKSEHVRTCSTDEIKKRLEEKREDPPKSPKGDLAAGKSEPEADPIRAWFAIQEAAGGMQALGLERSLGRVQETPLDDNRALSWAKIWQELRQANPAPTFADLRKLGKWIAAGGNDGIVPWQALTKAGKHADVCAWIDRAARWDGISDPRIRKPPARAPAPDVDRTDDVLTRFEKGPRR